MIVFIMFLFSVFPSGVLTYSEFVNFDAKPPAQHFTVSDPTQVKVPAVPPVDCSSRWELAGGLSSGMLVGQAFSTRAPQMGLGAETHIVGPSEYV